MYCDLATTDPLLVLLILDILIITTLMCGIIDSGIHMMLFY